MIKIMHLFIQQTASEHLDIPLGDQMQWEDSLYTQAIHRLVGDREVNKPL